MSNQRLIELNNGAIFDLNTLVIIARQGLNDYALVLANCAATPKADIGDVEYIK